MKTLKLSDLIREKSRKFGFDEVGFASAHSKPPHGSYLREWLANGLHGEMHWFENYLEKRLDVQVMEPWAESIIVFSLNYYTSYEHSEETNKAKISRYAWGKDYHKIIKKKLKRLLNELIKLDSDLHGRIFCDTAPIQEKLWAVEAGIGWQGKNTNIINKDGGSWFFIGGIVINKKLEYNTPVTDYCGSCTACIDACPTDALQPYKLDANRCISYITIEYWDKIIPQSIAEKLNGWVFGCDICQDVCPWNKFAKESKEDIFHPQKMNVSPDFDELLKMDEQGFKERFKKTPVYRAKYKNFIRNVETAKLSSSP